MQIDILWLRNNFRLFNKQYFGGILPEPRFHIGRSRTRLGSLSYKRGLLGGRYQQAFTLSISNYYDQTEYQFRNVLLHEMIHLSIAASHLRDTSPHGIIFRGIMSRLNSMGWNISVTTPMRDTPKAYTGSSKVVKNHLVLALEMTDGRLFLSSVNPKSAHTINGELLHVPEVRHFAWYTTNDHFFDNMPRVRSLRGRRVDADTFKKKTSEMKPL